MTTVDTHLEPKRGEPRRDRWGRYLLPDPRTGTERAWTRVTTVAGLLSDRYNLELWGKRMVAAGLASRPDLLALAKMTHPSNKRALNKIVGDALEAGNTEQRANLGTAIHAATEALDRGEDVDIPAPYDRDVAAYGAKMGELQLEVVPEWIERIVVLPDLGLAGTLDRMVTRSDFVLPRIADIKTGGTVHFAELDHAIQQSIYANATHYWDAEQEKLVPCPPIDKDVAFIIHVPAGEARCEVHALDIKLGFEAAKLAVEIKRWRSRKGLSAPYEPAPSGA